MSDGSTSILGDYYGIDWATLACGVTGNFITTNLGKLYVGMSIGLFSCAGGMAVAVMSHQGGFVVYNAILMSLNLRGLYKGWRRSLSVRQQISNAEAPVRVQSVAANDPAPARDPYPSVPAVAA